MVSYDWMPMVAESPARWQMVAVCRQVTAVYSRGFLRSGESQKENCKPGLFEEPTRHCLLEKAEEALPI